MLRVLEGLHMLDATHVRPSLISKVTCHKIMHGEGLMTNQSGQLRWIRQYVFYLQTPNDEFCCCGSSLVASLNE